jgi:secondary thiamine-phosphate synthase enzyme
VAPAVANAKLGGAPRLEAAIMAETGSQGSATRPRATFEVRTPQPTVLVPIGRAVQAAIDGWKVQDGAVLVSVGHTTCGVTLNEPEPDVLEDLAAALERLAPWDGSYAHNRGAEENAAAHIRALLVGHQVIVRLARGRLATGTWQEVLLVECDGPRTRQVELALLG